ncbi:hypothetical protein NKH19_23320 [Mesorhizobium sp. M1338]|uniref:hypothetical protein n=1 Tax=unclassified Mesorhizobium TaxID=325217 RepID=UPI003334E9F1
MPHSVLNAPINTVREGLIDDMTLRRARRYSELGLFTVGQISLDGPLDGPGSTKDLDRGARGSASP